MYCHYMHAVSEAGNPLKRSSNVVPTLDKMFSSNNFTYKYAGDFTKFICLTVLLATSNLRFSNWFHLLGDLTKYMY